MNLFKRSRTSSPNTNSTVGRSTIWSAAKFSFRQYTLVTVGLLVLAGGVLIFAASSQDTGANPANPYNIQIGVMNANSDWGSPNNPAANYIEDNIPKGDVVWDRLPSGSALIPIAIKLGYDVVVETDYSPSDAENTINDYKSDGNRVVFEFGNEPWEAQTADPVGTYASSYEEVYNWIHTAGSGVTQPLLFMTAGTGNVAGAPSDTWLDAAKADYAAANPGKQLQVDALSAHPYGQACSGGSGGYGVNGLIAEHADAVQDGYANTPWYVTEFGYTLNPAEVRADTASTWTGTSCTGTPANVESVSQSGGWYVTSYAEQKTQVINAYQEMMTLPWLKMIMYYASYDDGTGSFGVFNFTNAGGKDYAGEPEGQGSGSAAPNPASPRPALSAILSFVPGSSGGGGGGDTTDPTANMTAPANGATVSGTTTISASASDNVGVASIQFMLDGKPLGPIDSGTSLTSDSYSWNTTGVQNGSHTLTAVASDAAGNTGTATAVTVNVSNKDTTPPSTPTGLKATAPTSAAVNLSWNASADNVGVTEYKIYRNSGLSPIATVTAPATSYTDNNVSASTSYSYTVTALDAAGNQSAQSSAATVTTPGTTDKTPPSVPQNLHSTATTTSSISLAWSASTDNTGGSGLAGYHVYRGGTLIASPTGTTYTDTGLTASTSYTYTVSAYDNAANGSAASSPLTVSTQGTSDTQAPSTPTSLTAVAPISATVNLSWNASTDNVGVTEYKIYRGTTAGTSATLVATIPAPTGSTVTYADNAVSASTAYTYTVTALDAAGNQSAHSAPATATTPAATDKTPPTVPANVHSTTTTTTSIALAWTASTDTGGSGLAGYHVYRNGNLVASPSTNAYTDINLSPGTSYTYTVSAYDNAANGSAASSPVTLSTQSATTGGSVSNFQWNTSTKSLSWKTYPGATGYVVATVSNPTTTRNTIYTYPPVTGTGYTPAPLSGQTVNYGILPVVVNANGTYTTVSGADWATEVTVSWPTGSGQLGAPTNFHATAETKTSIALAWTAPADSSGIAGYHLYRNGLLIASPTGTTYTDSTGLTANTAYTYTLTAYDNAGNVSGATTPLKVTTSGRPWWHFW